MNTLATSIQSLGLTGTPAVIVAAFGGNVDLPHNHDWRDYRAVGKAYGANVAEGIYQALIADGKLGAAQSFCSPGYDLSDEQVQATLTAIADKAPLLRQACIALKAIGRPTQKLWETAGLEALPTVEQVTAAIAQITNQQAVALLMNECINPAAAADSATVASVKAAVAAWEV